MREGETLRHPVVTAPFPLMHWQFEATSVLTRLTAVLDARDKDFAIVTP